MFLLLPVLWPLMLAAIIRRPGLTRIVIKHAMYPSCQRQMSKKLVNHYGDVVLHYGHRLGRGLPPLGSIGVAGSTVFYLDMHVKGGQERRELINEIQKIAGEMQQSENDCISVPVKVSIWSVSELQIKLTVYFIALVIWIACQSVVAMAPPPAVHQLAHMMGMHI